MRPPYIPLFPREQVFLSFDCESVGLFGETFAVAGQVFDLTGKVYEEFAWHCDRRNAPGTAADIEWVDEHVRIPGISDEVINADKLCLVFAAKVRQLKETYLNPLLLADVCWPVEAGFLLRCRGVDPGFPGPYPLLDVSNFMLAAGWDPTKHYPRRKDEEPAHNPLTDSRQSARLFREVMVELESNKRCHYNYFH